LLLTGLRIAAIFPLHFRIRGNPGKDGIVTLGKCVLVVDTQAETAEVLSAVLEPRGVRVERARAPEFDRPGLPSQAPTVVVLDEETARARGIERADWPGAPRVILGTLRFPEPPAGYDDEGVRYLEKPYHYGDLIRAIESLIFPRAA
jgi:DNA-binding response OmpR family regulator